MVQSILNNKILGKHHPVSIWISTTHIVVNKYIYIYRTFIQPINIEKTKPNKLLLEFAYHQTLLRTWTHRPPPLLAGLAVPSGGLPFEPWNAATGDATGDGSHLLKHGRVLSDMCLFFPTLGKISRILPFWGLILYIYILINHIYIYVDISTLDCIFFWWRTLWKIQMSMENHHVNR